MRRNYFEEAATRLEDFFIALEHEYGVRDHTTLAEAYWSYLEARKHAA